MLSLTPRARPAGHRITTRRECTTMHVLAMQTAAESSWTDRADRQHVRRQLAPSRRADRQLRHRVRGAVHARLQADPADSRGAAPADRRRPGQRREDQGGVGTDRGGAPGHPDQGRRRGKAIDRGSPRGGRPGPGGGDAQGHRRRRTDCRQGARSGRARARHDARGAQTARSAASWCRRRRRSPARF